MSAKLPHPPFWKKLRRWFLRLFAVGSGVVLGVGFVRMPAFAIAEVEVVGIQRLSAATVKERVALQGQNLLSLAVQEVAANLTQDPWLRRVEVQRQLPGKVTIFVDERRPAVVWQAGKQQFLVDPDGTVLEENTGVRGLPLVRALDGAVPRPGERVDAEAVSLAITLTEVLPQELGENAKSFEYLSYGGLVVETDKGRRARFGDASDLPWKLAVWKAVLKAGAERGLKVGHVDLRFGDRPFFRP